MIFGCDDFRSGPMFADNYRLLAIIAINRNYCQNCEKITSIINIIIVITSRLSGNYLDNLAIITIIWQVLPLVGRARSCRPNTELVIFMIVCQQWSCWGLYHLLPTILFRIWIDHVLFTWRLPGSGRAKRLQWAGFLPGGWRAGKGAGTPSLGQYYSQICSCQGDGEQGGGQVLHPWGRTTVS